MVKIVFADSWQTLFAEFGLNSFDDFFRFSGAERIGRNNKRDISIVNLGDGSDRKVFFLKRFYNPRLKDIISAWRSFAEPTSQAGG